MVDQPGGQDVGFVDWDLAATTAGMLGKTGPAVSLQEATDVVAELRLLADEAAGHVEVFTGLAPISGPAPVRVVDRRDWAAVNIDGLRRVVVPLLSRVTGARMPGPFAEAVGSRVTAVQTGSVLAYLLLVAPNIVEVERKLNAVPRDFRLWVCLHEVTHRTQFTAVPWLRSHFLGEVASFVDAGGAPDQMAQRLRHAIGGIVEVIRNPESRVSVIDLIQTPAQRIVLDRITALMTLLEGHAEYVMDGVGPEVIPSVDAIRTKFNQRREGGNSLERLFRRLIGVDAKMRQYSEGRRFVQAVVESIGMAGFNKVWDSPLTLPLLSELSDPEAWVERVIGTEALHVSPTSRTVPPPAPEPYAPPEGTEMPPPQPGPPLSE
jgi:uncharacterized protein (DUF2342 family)